MVVKRVIIHVKEMIIIKLIKLIFKKVIDNMNSHEDDVQNIKEIIFVVGKIVMEQIIIHTLISKKGRIILIHIVLLIIKNLYSHTDISFLAVIVNFFVNLHNTLLYNFTSYSYN